MCKGGKQEISLASLNTFMDGVLSSKLHKSNVIVRKKFFGNENILKVIKDHVDPNNAEKNIKNPQFLNNYVGFIRSLSQMEALPIEFFEDQLQRFILPHFSTLKSFGRMESLGFLLHTFVKLNIRTPEAEKVKVLILQETIIPQFLTYLKEGKTVLKSHFFNYMWCLVCEERYQPEFWPKEIVQHFNSILQQPEKFNEIDLFQLL